MMKRNTLIIAIFAVAALIIMAPYMAVGANNPPHVPQNSVNCESCHLPATDPVWAIGSDPDPDQNEPYNRICWKCHNDTITTAKKTHSSTSVESTKYGNWKFLCTDCHNPHSQAQVNFNTYATGLSGTITAVNAPGNQVTLSVSLPARTGIGDATNTNDYIGWTIVPNRTYKTINYKISANADVAGKTVITVNTVLNATRVPVGSSFGVLPGKYVKDVLYTPGGAKNGKLFALEGPGSLVHNDTLAGGQDSTPDGMCQICHGIRSAGASITRSRADGTGFGDGHPTDTSAYCTTCHDHAQLGLGGGGCTGCHGNPPVDLATLIVKDKTGVAATSSSTLAGVHSQHITQTYQCANCHNGGMLTGAGAGDNKINLGFKIGATTFAANYNGQAAVNAGTFPYLATAPTTVSATGTLECSNLYCHSNVQGVAGSGVPTTYASPKWDGTVPVVCGSCHDSDGVQGTATTMSTGSHTKHANAATGYGRPCSTCHANPGAAGHVDYSIAVTVNATYGGTYNGTAAPGDGYSTCSSVYCHSDAKATPNYVTTVTWGGAATTCTSCHGGANGSAGGTGTTPLGLNHPVHTNATYNYGCTDCHNTVASDNTTISNKTLHVNKTRDVSVAAARGGDGNDYNSGPQTCSTTNCHGTTSPAWGTDLSAYDNCTICHGTKTTGADGSTIAGANPEKVAPGGTGTDTSGVDSANTDAQVGAHQAHLAATHTYSSKIACSECHTVPATVLAAGHIDSALPAEVPLAGSLAATNVRSVAGTPGYSAPNCSNVYCHDYQRFKNGWADDVPAPAANRTPAWNVPMLGGADDCQQCHGFPPAGGHPAATATQCTTCHNHVNGTGTGFSDATKHVNGLVEAGCDACHGNPPTTATYGGTTGLVGSGLGTGDTGATNPLSPGAHNKHVNGLTGRGMQCNACHNGNTMPTLSNTIQMGFAVNVTNVPSWGATAVTTGTFTGYNALSNGFTFVSSSAGTTVGTAANYNNTCSALYCHGSTLTGGTDPTPDFVTAGTGQCGTCHGATAAAAPTAGNHTKHASTSGYSFSCDLCHPAMGANESLHVDGSVAWSISTSDARTNGGTYKTLASGSTGGLAPSGTYGDCATLYCHSQGTADVSPYPAPNTTATWNTSLTCEGCHSGNAGATNKMATGSHTEHINNAAVIATNYGCQECHNSTTTDGTSITNTANHVNKTKDVSIVKGGTWTSGTATCSSVYCHSSGKGTYVNPPVWGSATDLTCAGCHGTTAAVAGTPDYANAGEGLPNANSHPKHVAAAADCNTCHTNTTTTGAAIKAGSVLHTNNAINVSFDTTKAGASAAYASGTKTCSTTYCHGTGAPVWGGAMLADCTSCHGGNAGSATPITLVNHPDHMNNAAVLGTNYECAQCHNTTVSAGNDRAITGTVHADQTKNVSMALGGTWTSGTATCSTVYCHSDGQPVATRIYATVPTWGSATDLICNGCHGTGNALGRPDYASGAAGSATANSHTKHATVAADCNTCHTNTTTNGTAIKAGSVLHTNQAENVDFDTTKAGASAAYASGTKTCSTTYCHGAGAPVWGGALADVAECDSCHGGNAASTATLGLGPIVIINHPDHMNNAAVLGTNYECAQCHNTTVSAGNDRAITGTVHADQTKNVSMALGGTWTSGTATCSTVYCHSDGQPVATRIYATVPTWGSVTDLTCNSCHGTGNALGRPDYASGAAGSATANSHTKHVAAAADCNTCHTNTTTSGTAIKAGSVLHTNQAENVDFDTTKAGAGATWTVGTKTCSTTYCHGNTTPTWGATSTGCNFCHPYTASNWIDGIPTATPLAVEGYGAHAKHITHIAARFSVTLAPLTDSFGTGNAEKVCGTCHTNTAGNHISGSRSINFGDATYKEGGSTGFSFLFDPNAPGTNPPLYNGVVGNSSSVDPKSCSAVGCHFTTTPVWSSY